MGKMRCQDADYFIGERRGLMNTQPELRTATRVERLQCPQQFQPARRCGETVDFARCIHSLRNGRSLQNSGADNALEPGATNPQQAPLPLVPVQLAHQPVRYRWQCRVIPCPRHDVQTYWQSIC